MKIIHVTDEVKIAIAQEVLKYKSAEFDCVTRAILQNAKSPKCPVEKLPEKFSVFQKLIKNNYLFYTSEIIAGYLVCGENRFRLDQQLGVVTIMPGCYVENDYQVINSPVDAKMNYLDGTIYNLPEDKINYNYSLAHLETLENDYVVPALNLPAEDSNEYQYIKKHNIGTHVLGVWIVLGVLVALLAVVGLVRLIPIIRKRRPGSIFFKGSDETIYDQRVKFEKEGEGSVRIEMKGVEKAETLTTVAKERRNEPVEIIPAGWRFLQKAENEVGANKGVWPKLDEGRF